MRLRKRMRESHTLSHERRLEKKGQEWHSTSEQGHTWRERKMSRKLRDLKLPSEKNVTISNEIDYFSFSPVGRIQYIDSWSPLQFVTERAASVPEELMHFMLRVSHDSMAVGPAGGTLPLLITHTTSLYMLWVCRSCAQWKRTWRMYCTQWHLRTAWVLFLKRNVPCFVWVRVSETLHFGWPIDWNK